MEKIVLLMENKEEGKLILSAHTLPRLTASSGDPALCCIVPMCQGLNRLHLPADITAPLLQNLLEMVADILTVSKRNVIPARN
jgi:hypothetical protein